VTFHGNLENDGLSGSGKRFFVLREECRRQGKKLLARDVPGVNLPSLKGLKRLAESPENMETERLGEPVLTT
jgi:hypothetical protein